jgi:hypothetical protein
MLLGTSLGASLGRMEGKALGADEDEGSKLGSADWVGSKLTVGTALGPLDGWPDGSTLIDGTALGD